MVHGPAFAAKHNVQTPCLRCQSTFCGTGHRGDTGSNRSTGCCHPSFPTPPGPLFDWLQDTEFRN